MPRPRRKARQRVREAFPAAVILRPSIVFGPEDGFFNKFAGLARISPALPLIGGGQTRFQPVFVGDVAAGHRRGAGRCRSRRARTYELGGPMIYTFKELMQIVLRETGRKRALVPLPFGLASLKAFFLQLLPNPLLTPDQVRLLKSRQCGVAHRAGLGRSGHHADLGGSGSARLSVALPRQGRICRPGAAKQ